MNKGRNSACGIAGLRPLSQRCLLKRDGEGPIFAGKELFKFKLHTV